MPLGSHVPCSFDCSKQGSRPRCWRHSTGQVRWASRRRGREELGNFPRSRLPRFIFISTCVSRCHPLLRQIPSQLFYENRLLDGVSAETRFPFLVPMAGAQARTPFPALMFCDCPLSQESGNSMGGGSLTNQEEARAIQLIVEALLIHGVKPSQIGIIAPFRAQVRVITDSLKAVNVEARLTQPPDLVPSIGQVKKKGKTISVTKFTAPQVNVGPVSATGIQVSTFDAFQVSKLAFKHAASE